MELTKKELVLVNCVLDGTYPSQMLLACKEGINVRALIQNIRNDVIAAGEEYPDITEVPEHYFAKYGVWRLPIRTFTTQHMVIRKPHPYEEAGIEQAKCMHCSHYNCGVCSHYGGTVDPEVADCDRMSGAEIFQLVYKGDEDERCFNAYVFPPDDLDAPKIAELVNDSDFPEVQRFFAKKGKDIDLSAFELRGL